ncbi:hypothetical protein JTB14_022085 [Gonioctena quinquepunctata]|nr:hypothetical protein JTB14_022085 [Gonioctena quinquepunctata]
MKKLLVPLLKPMNFLRANPLCFAKHTSQKIPSDIEICPLKRPSMRASRKFYLMKVNDGAINSVMTTVRHRVAINSFNNFSSSWWPQFIDPPGISLEVTASDEFRLSSYSNYGCRCTPAQVLFDWGDE